MAVITPLSFANTTTIAAGDTISVPYMGNSTSAEWILTNSLDSIIPAVQAPREKTNIDWLNERVQEMRDCWKG